LDIVVTLVQVLVDTGLIFGVELVFSHGESGWRCACSVGRHYPRPGGRRQTQTWWGRRQTLRLLIEQRSRRQLAFFELREMAGVVGTGLGHDSTGLRHRHQLLFE